MPPPRAGVLLVGNRVQVRLAPLVQGPAREVSRLLREEFGQGQCHWPDLFRDMLAEILECNETLDAGPLYDQMAEKLADLIDPEGENDD